MTDTIKALVAAKTENLTDKVYHYMVEVLDRRTTEYNKLAYYATLVSNLCGKDSIELNAFFDADFNKAKEILKEIL